MTTSNASSANGSGWSSDASIKVASGVRSRAIASSSGSLSKPVTIAPRAAAIDAASPEPQRGVEQPRPRADLELVQQGLEQRRVLRLGELGPVARAPPPDAGHRFMPALAKRGRPGWGTSCTTASMTAGLPDANARSSAGATSSGRVIRSAWQPNARAIAT